MTDQTEAPTEYELNPIGTCQRDGCGLGRGASVHSGKENDYHGYQPALRATPEAEAAIEGLVRALMMVRGDRPSAHHDNVWLAINVALEAARLAGLTKEQNHQ